MPSTKKNTTPLLIVGLGNPGEEYSNTPHNAGFLVIESLLKEFGGLEASKNKKLHARIAEHKLGKTPQNSLRSSRGIRKIILARPQTFMNNSGTAVKSLALYYKLKPENSLWLIHDDVDLELGKIKIVKNRGSAGHKGVEDVIKKLKTKNFVRFRIGIRAKNLKKKRPKTVMNKFVASDIRKADQHFFRKSLKLTRDAVLLALEEGVEKAMGVYNAK